MLLFVFEGKFGATAAFAVVIVQTAELYPTAIRGTALGLCSTVARIAGFLAPQVGKLNFNNKGSIQFFTIYNNVRLNQISI